MKKTKVKDLAIFGGFPAFKEQLHVGRPNIYDRSCFLKLVNDMLDRRWLTNGGPFVQELESKIAKYLGVKNCIVTCNATIALEVVIRALGLKGEVIVPSFTFVATPHALQWQEITPVFCDIDPRTHNLNPRRIEDMITPETTGIIGVHVWGRPCCIEELLIIAKRHNLKLIFDAAHAFGCSHKGRMLGNFGEAEVFSFHATKFFNTCEGGAITTNDDALSQKIRLMINFGFEGNDRVIYLGINGKMSELSAAMGLVNIENPDGIIHVNYINYMHYQNELRDVPGVRMIEYNENEHNNYQYIVLEIDEAEAHISRDHLCDILQAENVLARRYFYPGCHAMEPYKSYYPKAGLHVPETVRMVKRTLLLPNGTTIGTEEITNICKIIQLAVTYGSDIREAFAEQTS